MCKGFGKFSRCGYKRSDGAHYVFWPLIAVGLMIGIVFGSVGVGVTSKYRRCTCLAETEWLSDCSDGIAYGYNFNITCPTIETFYKPDYVTSCEDPNRIEKYRWEVGVEETCWIVLDTKTSVISVSTSSSSSTSSSASTSSANITANRAEPVPETREEINYDVEEISRNSLGLGFIITASVSLVIAIIAGICVSIWAKCS